MKKITKILIASSGILAGVTAVTKLIQSEEAKEDKKDISSKDAPKVVIIGEVKEGKTKPMDCCRHTCHATPTSRRSEEKEQEEKKARENIIRKNTKALQSLNEEEQTLVKGIVDFLRESDLAEELDDSVTVASIIDFMKETDMLDKLMNLCAKKGVAYDDTENVIRILFKAGRFNKRMNAEQKLSVILDELSDDYFQYDDEAGEDVVD